LNAAVTLLEALQRAGYFLHDSTGRCLDHDQFIAAVTEGLNAALATVRPLPSPPVVPQEETTKKKTLSRDLDVGG
jgi:hypothetical protein